MAIEFYMRKIPSNMNPWVCSINDVELRYPAGTEQMVPYEVAHVIDAWYASQEPKYPEPVQPEGGGGGQSDWAAAEGEAGHILNRTHYWKTVEGESVRLTGLVDAGDGMYMYFGDPVSFIPGREYSVRYAETEYTCIGADPAALGDPMDGGCVLGNIGAFTGGEDTGEPFVIFSYGRSLADAGGASMMIADMSGSAPEVIFVNGPYRVREKLAPEWLPIPGVTLLTYQASVDSDGSFTVPHTYDYSDIAARIAGGEIVMARLNLGHPFFIGLNFDRATDSVIRFSSFDATGKITLSIEATGFTSITTSSDAST